MKAGHAHQTLRISESTLKAAQIHKIFSWIWAIILNDLYRNNINPENYTSK